MSILCGYTEVVTLDKFLWKLLRQFVRGRSEVGQKCGQLRGEIQRDGMFTQQQQMQFQMFAD